MNKPLLGFALFPCLIVLTLVVGLIAQSCAGSNPPGAPFGSVVEFNIPPSDISLGNPEALEPMSVSARVLDPDGLPTADVEVRFDLSFAGANSRIVDSDGDGDPDARLLQLVDPNGCEEVSEPCENVDQALWFGFNAFVDSPFFTLTDDDGNAKLIILVSGSAVADPASLTASSGSADPDVAEFSVNTEE